MPQKRTLYEAAVMAAHIEQHGNRNIITSWLEIISNVSKPIEANWCGPAPSEEEQVETELPGLIIFLQVALNETAIVRRE